MELQLHEIRQAYIPVALLGNIYKYPRQLFCGHRKCKENRTVAKYVLVSGLGSRKFVSSRSGHCLDHVKKASKRSGYPIVDEWSRIIEIESAINEYDVSLERSLQDRRAAEEKRIMEQQGKILRLTGENGQIFETPDKNYCFVLKGSAQMNPSCCWAHACFMIRKSGWNNEHSSNCVAVRKEEDHGVCAP